MLKMKRADKWDGLKKSHDKINFKIGSKDL